MSRKKLRKSSAHTGDPELGRRIREIREREKLSQKAFGEKVGRSDAAINRYENGEHYPKHEVLVEIARLCGVTLEWLREGDSSSGANFVNEKAPPYGKSFSAPIIGRASANSEGRIEWDAVEHEYVEIPGHVQFVQVEDSSMSPTIWPGQFVIVDSEAVIRENDLVVIKVKGHPGPLLKRISYDKNTDTIALSSVDQSEPRAPIIVPKTDVKTKSLVVGGWYLGKHRQGRIIKFD